MVKPFDLAPIHFILSSSQYRMTVSSSNPEAIMKNRPFYIIEQNQLEFYGPILLNNAFYNIYLYRCPHIQSSLLYQPAHVVNCVVPVSSHCYHTWILHWTLNMTILTKLFYRYNAISIIMCTTRQCQTPYCFCSRSRFEPIHLFHVMNFNFTLSLFFFDSTMTKSSGKCDFE